MLLYTMCKQCMASMSRDERDRHSLRAPVTDKVVQILQCTRGHTYAIALQQPMFTLIFERALYRLAKESVRDAVIDAHTALDMYLPHVPARARYDQETSASARAVLTKLQPLTYRAEMARIAAHTTVFLLGAGNVPRGSIGKLRNQAVHEGRYPQMVEATEAITGVAETIRAFEDALASRAPTAAVPYWQKYFAEERARGCEELGDPLLNPSTVWVNAALDLVLERKPHDLPHRIAEYAAGGEMVVG
jgi:hypothetical protein